MRYNKNVRNIKRTAISLAVSLSLATIAHAQVAEGSIFGHTAAKGQVTVHSPDTGTTRTITADNDGSFTLSRLQPGHYTVTSGGVTREVNVAIGSGTEVKFNDVSVVTVTGARTRSAIDVSSFESNTVLTQAEIQALPVPRSATMVSLLAPGVVKGNSGFGDGTLPSFNGASVAENGYYINGFDVTNIRNFTSYATLPFDSIEQQQVKTGGYGAEYGRSLGGVIALSTKRGTNTWKSGVATYWSPNSLRSKGTNVNDLNPDNNVEGPAYTVFGRDHYENHLSVNAWTGGPLIKDKLFFFGIIEDQRNKFNDFGSNQNTRSQDGRPNGLIKLDFLPSADHRLEFTGITNKQTTKYWDYNNHMVPSKASPGDTIPAPYAEDEIGPGAYSENESGGYVAIGKYTGYITDNLTVSAQVGKVYDLSGRLTGARMQGKNCPVVYDTALNPLGCWVPPFPSGTRDPKAPDDSDTRKSSRLDLEYTLNNHTIRGGYDGQKFDSAGAGGSSYSGGVYWRYFKSSTGTVNGVKNAVPVGGTYVRQRTAFQTSGIYDVKNTAWYIEDSWNVTKDIMLYGGLRGESFNNKNSIGESFVKADNLLAPRLGASWNVNGDGSLKVYGSAGRYYIPVASNTNIRSTRSEYSTQDFFTYTSIDPTTGAPVGLGPEIGTGLLTGRKTPPNPGTVADTNLKPMSQDELIIGFQKAISKNWSVGMKFIDRKINNGMDDYCEATGIMKWAADNHYNNFDWTTLATCVLMNPGNDLHLNVDLNNDGKLTNVTIPKSYLGLAKYERKYQALEFSMDRPYDGHWSLSGSYVLSRDVGTAEGYVQSTLVQADAGITQDFDFGSFTDGAYGPLPNDHRHTLKLYGAYGLNDNFRIGFNFAAQSGMPLSCVGYVPSTVSDYYGPNGAPDTTGGSGAYTSASAYYCLDSTGHSVLHTRGSAGRTPWTKQLDLSGSYMTSIGGNKLTLQADVFNVFNSRTPVDFNQVRDYSRADVASGKLNPNYGQPTSFMPVRSVRFTARYEF